jgi:predicted RNA-binding Zn ribbon-like protein
MNTATHEHVAFDLDAGELCLDFANTLDGRLDPEPHDELGSYDALLLFARLAGAIDDAEAARLTSIAARQPDAAAAAWDRATRLRETVFNVFDAIARGGSPSDTDLAGLNAALAEALPHGRIAPQADARFVWVWEESDDLDRPLWSIAHSAGELLLRGNLARLRECAANDCAWLFIDTTRNRSRRWCSMSSCGNRAKVQQFRERQRGGA